MRWTETRTREHARHRPRPGPDAGRRDRRHPRRHGAGLPARRPAGLPAPTRRSAPSCRVHDPHDGAGRLRHPEVECTARVGRHQHHADRRLPRRRPARGHRRHRAGDRPVRRRDRHGPGRGAPAEPDRRSSTSPHTTAVGHDLRQSATTRRRSTSRSRPPATTTCGPSSSAGATPATPVQLGIGVAVYVEITGGAPPATRTATSRCSPTARAIVHTGTSPHGQGHDTAWSMIASRASSASRWTDRPSSTATPTSCPGRRHHRLALAAARRRRRAARPPIEVVEQAKQLRRRAARGDADDVVLDKVDGALPRRRHAGRGQTWAEVRRRRAADAARRRRPTFTAPSPTFPFGAHVAVVEVDTETGQVKLVRHDRRRRRRPRPQPAARRGPASTAASPRARPRRCRGGRATTTTATRSRRTSPTTPSSRPPSCPASSSCRWRRRRRSTRSAPRASASRARSAPRRRCSRRWSTPCRHLGVRHIDMPAHRRAGVAGHPGASDQLVTGESVQSITVNGDEHDGRRRAAHAARPLPPRRRRPHRHERRLRHVVVRRLHGALDGESVKSCTVLAVQADGCVVTHHRGPGPDGDELHPMQEAFREHHGLQCGYCTPGMVMAAVSLLDGEPAPDRGARCARASRATSAAAPATTTSSRRSSPRPARAVRT